MIDNTESWILIVLVGIIAFAQLMMWLGKKP